MTNLQDMFDNSHYNQFNYQKGRKHTEEACANMSKAQTGKKLSAETRAKISDSMIGRVISQESRDKSRASNKGQTRSAETRAKLKAASKARKDAGIPGPRTGKGKTVMTPQGIMTTTAAAQLYGVENRHIRHWVKTKPNNFYYVQPKLDKEAAVTWDLLSRAAVPDTPSLDTVMAAWASQSVKDLV